MQKIRKILCAVSEKTALPTNQPTNQLLPTASTLLDLADASPKRNILRFESFHGKTFIQASID